MIATRSAVLTWQNADQPTPIANSCALPSQSKINGFIPLSLLESFGPQCLPSLVCDSAAPSLPSWAYARSNTLAVTGGAVGSLGRFAKRALDLLLSSLVLLLLWPLLLLIALAVKLQSPGPVIYRSRRAGEKGIPFSCYKFRTMVAGANELRTSLCHLNQRCGPFFKIANDPRVTRLGRFLRKYSLDELPQLWNVLRGDMSLVGPRPHPVEDVQQYRSEHEQRFEVKPGMTGLWQVTARGNPSFQLCMLLDVGYICQWSLLLDFKILLRTIPAVLAGEGQ